MPSVEYHRRRSGIESVADTALWIAGYRAMETERRDALFRDPLAAVLAGTRGRDIARSMPNARATAWGIALRTRAIDEFVLSAVHDRGVDTVLNLGAGLDTRPYRLDLPARLRWVEADFPDMIAFKEERLRARVPRCRLERRACDLSGAADRDSLFESVAEGSRCVLVITEGVIAYLTEEQAAELSRALLGQPRFRYWVQDVSTSSVMRRVRKRWAKQLEHHAPFRFFPSSDRWRRDPNKNEWVAFFEGQGWKTTKIRYSTEEGERLQRAMPLSWLLRLAGPVLGASKRNRIRTMSGYVMLQRKNDEERS
ncbi:class I SAM-dependent methyltransferase [Pendulispora rubella]|uniref:S-adenosyl-L-methionine-dependent methyltransferase n=1 Tax=Pendulispora rubella TaxID=2741070 RepID=A0ABZ2KUM8_9BACT